MDRSPGHLLLREFVSWRIFLDRSASGLSAPGAQLTETDEAEMPLPPILRRLSRRHFCVGALCGALRRQFDHSSRRACVRIEPPSATCCASSSARAFTPSDRRDLSHCGGYWRADGLVAVLSLALSIRSAFAGFNLRYLHCASFYPTPGARSGNRRRLDKKAAFYGGKALLSA